MLSDLKILIAMVDRTTALASELRAIKRVEDMITKEEARLADHRNQRHAREDFFF